jgi:hypothetical protein
MHIVKNDETETEFTPAEKLAMLICELRNDAEELRYRLEGRRPGAIEEYVERKRRWKEVLAIVEAAVGGKR